MASTCSCFFLNITSMLSSVSLILIANKINITWIWCSRALRLNSTIKLIYQAESDDKASPCVLLLRIHRYIDSNQQYLTGWLVLLGHSMIPLFIIFFCVSLVLDMLHVLPLHLTAASDSTGLQRKSNEPILITSRSGTWWNFFRWFFYMEDLLIFLKQRIIKASRLRVVGYGIQLDRWEFTWVWRWETKHSYRNFQNKSV